LTFSDSHILKTQTPPPFARRLKQQRAELTKAVFAGYVASAIQQEFKKVD
jgi:hypothetical protein